MRLGLIGTFVWDTIWTLDDQRAGRPTESWGGMTYALSGAAAACPPGWTVVPIAKVGEDLVDRARAWAAAHEAMEATGIQSVPMPNNRVELRYTDASRRGEVLTGGVPEWDWHDLEGQLEGIDALYINYLSGFEIGLEATERLRDSFTGPVYGDLHSLFLGCPTEGERQRRRLPDWERWLRCFHAVQVNEEEFAMLLASMGPGNVTPGGLLEHGPGLVALTRGERGAMIATRLPESPAEWRGAPADLPPRLIEAPVTTSQPGDPTGCGDVWGATFFTRLLAGDGTVDAARAATSAATRKLSHRGADGLARHLARGG
jgi:sugar/nucleoside kinase (ribokinase family)